MAGAVDPSDVRLGLVPFLQTSYARSLKSARSDEWINTYAIRPAASVLVWLFYRLGLSPVQVVLLGAVAGTLCGPALWVDPGGRGLPLAGACLLAKNLLDAADGQLARATRRVDRVGRFADSITDFWVNGVVTLSTSVAVAPRLGWGPALGLGLAAFLLVLLQCSLFVFYQVSFLQQRGRSPANRTDERPLGEERAAPTLERRLQATYLFLYGWQDRWMAALDRACLRRAFGAGPVGEAERGQWYADAGGLRLTSFLGLGTSLTGYSIFLLAGSPLGALLWIVAGGTLVALTAILYRLVWLAPRIRPRGRASLKTPD